MDTIAAGVWLGDRRAAARIVAASKAGGAGGRSHIASRHTIASHRVFIFLQSKRYLVSRTEGAG